MADTHHPPWWERRLIAVLGGPQRAETVRFFWAWSQAEGGIARWNPLNTTYKLWNSTLLPGNEAGVQEYQRPTEGVCATCLTLVNGRYGTIVGAVQAGNKTAEQIVQACSEQIKVWGTDPDSILAVLAA